MIKKENYVSIIISVVALLISLSGIWLQFFRQSHDLSASVYNVVGPLKSGELTADIVFVNRGNQDEVVMSAYFIFDESKARVGVRSEEQLGPLVIKKGDANTYHLSAKMKLSELVLTMRDNSGPPERLFRKDLHTIHQGVVFEVLKPDGSVSEKLFPLFLFKATQDGTVELSVSRHRPRTFITLIKK